MRNVQISLTHFLNESRVLKEVNSLLKHQVVSEVIILALWKQGLKKTETISEHTRVIRIYPYVVYVLRRIFNLNEINFIKLLNIYITIYLIKLKPDMINLHHVNLLGIMSMRSLFKKCKFIYDTHELETETQSSVGQLKAFRRHLETKYISTVDYTFVVTPSIEEWYRAEYGIDRISTVMNTPRLHEGLIKRDFFREKFEIQKQATIFIYNGSLFKGRGIEKLLQVFEEINDKSHHIVFMGDGEYEDLILEYSHRNKNIHFHEAVEPNRVIDYTTSADVGVSLIENVCLSYYYCLPNKIFEYTMAELPMIVSNMKDMSNYIVKNHIGEVAKSFSVADITEAVEKIAKQKDTYKLAIKKAKLNFNWETEENKLIFAYQSILSRTIIF